MKKITLILFLITALFTFNINLEAKTNKNLVNIYFFHSNTCSHCKEETKFLNTLERKYDNIKTYKYEVHDKNNYEILEQTEKLYNIKFNSVPVTIIGDEVYTGFSEKSKIKFIKSIEYFSKYGYEDKIGSYLNLELPTYNLNKDDMNLETFIDTYHNYKLLGLETDNMSTSNIALLLGLLLSLNIIYIIGFLLILMINIKIKNTNLLILIIYTIINTILLSIALIDNSILTTITYILVILSLGYILIYQKKYMIYSITILISIFINLIIILLNNKTILIFKSILNLHNLIGLDLISYYSNFILTYFIINFIFIYIGVTLINKETNDSIKLKK